MINREHDLFSGSTPTEMGMAESSRFRFYKPVKKTLLELERRSPKGGGGPAISETQAVLDQTEYGVLPEGVKFRPVMILPRSLDERATLACASRTDRDVWVNFLKGKGYQPSR